MQGYETPATDGYISSTTKGTRRLDVESQNTERGLLEEKFEAKQYKMTNPIVPAMQTLIDQLRMQNGEDCEEVKNLVKSLSKYTNEIPSDGTTPIRSKQTMATHSTTVRITDKHGTTITPFIRQGSIEEWMNPTPLQKMNVDPQNIIEEEKVPGDFEDLPKMKATGNFGAE